MVENVIPIKNGITINFDASVKIIKNIMCEKKVIYGIQLLVVAKMLNNKQVSLTSQWDEIIEK